MPPVTQIAGQSTAQANTERRQVTALGRLEPRGGITRLSGPSRGAAVIAELRVEKGERVTAGQPIAVLDTFQPNEAARDAVAVELKHAENEYERLDQLYRRKMVAASEREKWEMKRNRLRADLRRAQVELDQSIVRSPIDGRILEVHARQGERVSAEGIVELGNTEEMYAIAEVYETDIGRVRVGQTASISSPALPRGLQGTVEQVGLKVGKRDVTDTDPLAAVDTRVVEVEIKLDDAAAAADMTYLQVDVTINSEE
jgi:multidrug resistance efflux pump